MARSELSKPKPETFDLASEWNYAMSVWYQDQDQIGMAQLYMQRAMYHQEKEHMEEFKLRQPKKLKLKTRAEAKVERDLEAAYHQAHGDAVAMAKNLYARNRARSPLKEEMPTWDKLTQGTQDIFINDVKAAISIVDERRAFRKEQTNGS